MPRVHFTKGYKLKWQQGPVSNISGWGSQAYYRNPRVLSFKNNNNKTLFWFDSDSSEVFLHWKKNMQKSILLSALGIHPRREEVGMVRREQGSTKLTAASQLYPVVATKECWLRVSGFPDFKRSQISWYGVGAGGGARKWLWESQTLSILAPNLKFCRWIKIWQWA